VPLVKDLNVPILDHAELTRVCAAPVIDSGAEA